MRKTIILFIVVIIALSLCACSAGNTSNNSTATTSKGVDSSNDNSPANSTANSSDSVSINEYYAITAGQGLTDILFSERSESYRASFSERATPDGYTIELNSDGSTLIYNSQKEQGVRQYPEGYWSVLKGEEESFGRTTWPTNKWTALVPEPPFDRTLTISNELAYIYSITGEEISYDVYYAYVDELKAMGYTEDVRSYDVDVAYRGYEASNPSNGHRVEVEMNSSLFSLYVRPVNN